MALFSAFALGLILFGVLAGPLIWRVPINEIDFAAKLQGPSWAHPLGTDDLGQDLLSRLIYGGRISIAVGFAAMVVAIFFGVLVGAVAGMSSGRVDAALMWVTDLFLSLPQLPLLLLVIYLFREPVKGVAGCRGWRLRADRRGHRRHALDVRRAPGARRSSSPCAKRNSSRRPARWGPRVSAR